MLVETSKNILQLQLNKVYILQEQIIPFICSEDSWKFQYYPSETWSPFKQYIKLSSYFTGNTKHKYTVDKKYEDI